MTLIIAKLVSITILKNVKLSKFGSSKYLEYTGRHKGCQISFSNGKVLDISVVAPYLVIDGKGYKCDANTLSKLNFFLEQVYKKYYHVST
ncbi:MAG TPA: hypothetical protein GXX17_07170 [Clostridiales bacterium]|nr:hypothetical protein [Clostridiales bacterium]